MKKHVLILILVGLAMSSIAMMYVFRPSKTKGVGEKPEIVISSNELYTNYVADEEKGDSLYRDKIIQVSGIVTFSIAEDNNYLVTLEGEETGGVKCSFKKRPSERFPEIGTECTIKGKCTGITMDVNISQCSILE